MSELKSLGMGIVAQDKNDNSKHIAVFLPESFPYHEGNITSEAKEITRKITDIHGNETENTVYKKMVVKAEWKGENNELYAPSVRAGQQVEVLEIDGTNIYFWKALGRDLHLRRGEKVGKVYNASNAKVTTAESLTKENTYGWVIDTNTGIVQFWTSKDNGEKAAFTVELNGKDGAVKVGDGENMIEIDSNTGTITGTTASGTSIVLEKKNVKVIASDTITFETKKCVITDKLIVEGDNEGKGDLKLSGDLKATNIDATIYTGDSAFISDVSGYLRG